MKKLLFLICILPILAFAEKATVHIEKTSDLSNWTESQSFEAEPGTFYRLRIEKEKPPIVPKHLWSDPATWGDLPHGLGDKVVIPEGMTVTLDQDIDVASLEVQGTLTIAPMTLNVRAGWILAHGGTITTTGPLPRDKRLTVTLTGINKLAVPGMGGRLFGAMMGGSIYLFGETPDLTWTMLDRNAQIGDDAITLAEAPDWHQGDHIVVTASSYDFQEAEEREVQSVDGRIVYLTKPLTFYHHGTISHFEHHTDAPHDIDTRAEVALLSHNIVIQGADDIPGFGGHIMIMDRDSIGQFRGVELRNMGQAGILGRYPIHWHRVKEGGSNSFIVSSSIRNANNRFLTIHRTDNLTVRDVVGYGTYGHGFFMEDGRETGNTIDHCIGLSVYPANFSPVGINLDVMPDQLNEQGDPGVFWLTNPNNTITNNAAAGSYPHSNGFFLEFRPTPHQGSVTYAEDPSYDPSAQPMGVFKGNRAHSIYGAGENVADHGYGFWIGAGSPGTFFNVDGFTTFSCGVGGMWTGGIEPPVIMDHLAIQAGTHGSLNRTNTIISHSLFARKTDNQAEEDFLKAHGITPSAIHIYEGHGGTTVSESVFIGFNTDAEPPAVILSNNPKINIGRDVLLKCEAIDSEIGLWNHENPDVVQFVVHDPDDIFGNGKAGAFIHSAHDSEWLRDQDSLTAETGAKGVPASWKFSNRTIGDSKLQSVLWSPRDYVTMTFSASAPTEGITIRRDKDGPELTSGQNYITSEMMLDKGYRVAGMDGSALVGGSLDITNAKAGDELNFAIKWMGDTVQARSITDMSHYPTEDVLTPAASMEDHVGGKGASVFVKDGTLYLRLPVETGGAASMRFTQ